MKKNYFLSTVIKEAKKELAKYPEILAAYLFGSFAEGFEKKRSDLDIAIYIDELLGKRKSFNLSLTLGEELERILSKKVDLLILNYVHPSLAFRALRGVLIIDRDPVKRSLFTAKIMSLYYDYKRFFEFYRKVLYKRIEENRFGTTG